MGIKDFRSRVEGRAPEEMPVSEVGPSPTTYIDQGCELSGKLSFKEAVQIDGHVEGEVRGEKTVIIGDSGTVHAKVEADFVVVRGTVEGDIVARRKITLHKSARVVGEICTAGIVVEEGARFTGRIVIGAGEKAPAQERARASTPRAASEPVAAQAPPAPPG